MHVSLTPMPRRTRPDTAAILTAVLLLAPATQAQQSGLVGQSEREIRIRQERSSWSLSQASKAREAISQNDYESAFALAKSAVDALPSGGQSSQVTRSTALDTLSKAGVATSVVTFGCEVSVLKDFNTPYQRIKPLLESLYAGGGTNDSTALQYAHNLLLSRQEERRVCFLLSDGIGDADQCREQALIGENLGLTTIGVGIRSDISHIYKNAVTIDKIEDMGTVAFDKLKLAA